MKRLWPLYVSLLGLGVWLACSDPVATADPDDATGVDVVASWTHPGPGACPDDFYLIVVGAGSAVDVNGDCAACKKVLHDGSTVTIDNNVGGPGVPGALCTTKKP